jgi:PhnB protein
MSVKPIPDGYHSVTPYLILSDASRGLEFYRKVFDATELMRMDGPGGKVMHAEIQIGNSVIMLADEFPEMSAVSPTTLNGTPVSLMIYVEDVDARFQRAVDAGATVRRAVQDQFYGDRSGTLVDPFGHVWTISTHIEDLTPDEIAQRAEQMQKQPPA